jgi:hypothetical protein
MKSFNLFAFISIVLFSLAIVSCKKDDDDDGGDEDRFGNNLKTGQVEIKGYPDETNDRISFEADVKKITIDWGDGKVETIESDASLREFSHEYANSSDLQTISINTETLEYIKFTNSDGSIHELRFGNSPKLEGLALGFYNAISNYGYLSELTVLEINKAELLSTLDIRHTALTSLDLTGCPALKELGCRSNEKLTSLDVSGCTALEYLYCEDYYSSSKNKLTTLNVSGCTALIELECSENQLTSLDVSGCPALYILSCSDNKLTSLDISKCTALHQLSCSSNQLTSLDVSKNTELFSLNCNYNQLTSLNVSPNNIVLTPVSCGHNQLDASALNSLFNSLPKAKSWTNGNSSSIYIGGNPGTDNCDISIAENKGWYVSTGN